jgi:hypothetical protein
MFSLLEQHIDGTWWYHPGTTFNTPEEVDGAFKRIFWWDLSRPHMVFEHKTPLYQKYSTCTLDFKKFSHLGVVVWEDVV